MKEKHHTRRKFLQSISATAMSLSLFHASSCTQSKKPNILFLFTDDQRFDTIRALGNQQIITPNMDYLVQNGVAFINTYIMGGQSAAVCMPSRAMLMTGRNLFHLQEQGRKIPKSDITLPERLRQAGYITFGTGKWHNGREAFARSFSTAAKIMFGGMSDHWRVPTHDFDPTGRYPREKQYYSTDKHSSTMYADAAINFLQNHQDAKPFFAYVSFQAPHDPRHMPQKYLDMYDANKIPLPKNFLPEHPFDNGELKVRDEKIATWPRTPEEIRRHIAAYYAMITHLDAEIGRIIDALEQNSKLENTIIVLAGDNGLAVGQHGLMGKQNLYEHSIHVPLIICGPGIPKGETRDTLCYLHDIYPTLCDLVQVTIPPSVESKSLVPVIKNESTNNRKALLFVYKNFQRGLRIDDWKLILYNVHGVKTAQLFDLQNDPCEMNNLVHDPTYRPRFEQLTKLLQKLIIENNDRVRLSERDWGVPVIPSWGQSKT